MNSRLKKLLYIVVLGCATWNIWAHPVTPPETTDKLIPYPESCLRLGADVYTLRSDLPIYTSDSSLEPIVTYLRRYVPEDISFVRAESAEEAELTIVLNEAKEGENAEGYSLIIGEEGIRIEANSYSGALYGAVTLAQLMPKMSLKDNHPKEVCLPSLRIQDAPDWSWRGLMLDSSRHFWTVQEVKQLLDYMAFYKLNKFHWHLTDDQGWRIEIKKYPLLTEKGAWRTFNSHDKECLRIAKTEDKPQYLLPEDRLKVVDGDTVYGGYYTQDDIREVVAYAKELGIDVIPEIDMPGHFLAGISNYPELGCDGLIGWGQTFSSPLCVGKNSTLQFCQDVWTEVMALFPYDYVHIGGDEVEKANWKKCQQCQQRIKEEGLKDEVALQAWFIREMESFFNANGKKMLGWDEVVEDGLEAPSGITWWRSWAKNSPKVAATTGLDIIFCPNNVFYFDYVQGPESLSNIIEFDPYAHGIPREKMGALKGMQANIWTEWIPSFAHLQYMLFPRVAALAQKAWNGRTDYNEFTTHLAAHSPIWDKMKINYRVPDIYGFYNTQAFTTQGELALKKVLPQSRIFYTTDGSKPTPEDKEYISPIRVRKNTTFTLATYRPDLTFSDLYTTKFVKQFYRPGIRINGKGLKKGLLAKWYDFGGRTVKEIEKSPFKSDHVIENVRIPKDVSGRIGLVIEGYMFVPKDDIYTFALLSDDGSTFEIGHHLVIDNDGEHSPKEVISQIALKRGLHTIRIKYFDQNGGILKLYMIDKEGNKVEVPASAFYR